MCANILLFCRQPISHCDKGNPFRFSRSRSILSNFCILNRHIIQSRQTTTLSTVADKSMTSETQIFKKQRSQRHHIAEYQQSVRLVSWLLLLRGGARFCKGDSNSPTDVLTYVRNWSWNSFGVVPETFRGVRKPLG